MNSILVFFLATLAIGSASDFGQNIADVFEQFPMLSTVQVCIGMSKNKMEAAACIVGASWDAAKGKFQGVFGKREKRQNFGQMWEGLPLLTKVQICMTSSGSKTEAAKCIVGNFGASFDKIKEKTKEWFSGKD